VTKPRCSSIAVSAFSDESWGGDPSDLLAQAILIAFQHSLMNLGVETAKRQPAANEHDLFQHSLMNLGVETIDVTVPQEADGVVSAFSDESWGGDPRSAIANPPIVLFQHSLMNLGVETRRFQHGDQLRLAVSAFSDESWGGDPSHGAACPASHKCFSIL